MKGFVPTPVRTVDSMIARLFQAKPPRKESRLLDPGCGHGAFIEGVLRWCRRTRSPCPEIVGIDLDPSKLRVAKRVLVGERRVSLVRGNFLTRDLGTFDYIVGNPPYVGIEELSENERARYRKLFLTARGRVDLYLLFWERAMQILRPSGRIVFITPEKFNYVETARPLRSLMGKHHVDELLFAPEDTFPGLTTYPVITVLSGRKSKRETAVRLRNGDVHTVSLPATGDSWQPFIYKSPTLKGSKTLADIVLRVSCGVATGADRTFLFKRDGLPASFAHLLKPTIAGRELRNGHPLPTPTNFLLVPYDDQGNLLPLERLGAAAEYLQQSEVREQLEKRTCVKRKPWYAFHETPPMEEMLRPKLLCKDIAKHPHFWIDREGEIMPLHSTYYIVPPDPRLLDPLAGFLNSREAHDWFYANCQRAANGFLRMQSTVLKRLPVPDDLLVEDSNRHSLAA